MPEPRILLDGLGIPESPRWHEGRLWFCNWIDRQVMAVDMDGAAEVVLTRDLDSHSMGYSIGWLPDGRLLVVSMRRPGSPVYACALGGADGRTLYACVAPDFDQAARTAAGEGSLVAFRVPVPAAPAA